MSAEAKKRPCFGGYRCMFVFLSNPHDLPEKTLDFDFRGALNLF
jgi:hypothetical protein